LALTLATAKTREAAAYSVINSGEPFRHRDITATTKESSVRRHQIGYPLKNTRLLLLSTNVARERLQTNTYLLPIRTSTADELCGGTNIDDLERH